MGTGKHAQQTHEISRPQRVDANLFALSTPAVRSYTRLSTLDKDPGADECWDMEIVGGCSAQLIHNRAARRMVVGGSLSREEMREHLVCLCEKHRGLGLFLTQPLAPLCFGPLSLSAPRRPAQGEYM